ncbi:uncharacterized mitochondrial protein-like protein, partial [Tanacetum coccineum]
MKALLRVLRYIKLCLGQGLHFSTENNLQLTAYCDSDWASCPVLGPCLISWSSKKQTVVSRSSTKAEYRALADCTYEITLLKCLFKDLNLQVQSPIPIYCDNSSTIALASNPIQHAKTKDIERLGGKGTTAAVTDAATEAINSNSKQNKNNADSKVNLLPELNALSSENNWYTPSIIDNHTFSNGLHAWYANCCDAFLVSPSVEESTQKSCKRNVVVTNRTQNWQGLEQDITRKVSPGSTYKD